MDASSGSEEAKRRAGEYAADRVEDGAVVGLGTGSTAAYAIRALGRAVDGGLDVRGVPTSYQSRRLAREVGVPVTDLDEGPLALAIDGADQVAEGDLVKGGGAAHAREKIVASAAAEVVIVVDPSKRADRLTAAVPVEILPAARPVVADGVSDLGGEPTLRDARRKDGPVVTDNGNLVLDCAFSPIDDPAALAADLSALPGVVEHGLFVDVADEIVVGREDGDPSAVGEDEPTGRRGVEVLRP